MVEQAVPIYTIQYKDERGQSAGSVVTIGDERVADKVIAFSETGQLDLFNGDKADFWQDRIAGYIHQQVGQYQTNLKEYESVQAMEVPMPGSTLDYCVTSYSQFCKAWHQGDPYNQFVPFKSGVKARVGCVAIAMGQVMAFHKWPQQGGSYYYYPLHNARDKHETTYTPYWDAMQYPTDRNEGEEMAARLLVEIGYKMQMNYGVYASSANHEWGCVKVFNQMGYYCDQAFVKFDVSSVEKVLQDLRYNRPVVMYGADYKVENAHLFVITGFRFQRHVTGIFRPAYIFIRNGDEGKEDGWYQIYIFSSESPQQGSYNDWSLYKYRYRCSVLCNIRPNPNNKGSFRNFRYELPFPFQPVDF